MKYGKKHLSGDQFSLIFWKTNFEDATLEEIIGHVDLDQLELHPDADRILLRGVDMNSERRVSVNDLPREQIVFFNRLLQSDYL